MEGAIDAYSIAEFCDRVKVTKPTVYKEIAQNRLRTFRVGRRRLISHRAAEEWLRQREREAAGG